LSSIGKSYPNHGVKVDRIQRRSKYIMKFD
jgi:hypothetical protein